MTNTKSAEEIVRGLLAYCNYKVCRRGDRWAKVDVFDLQQAAAKITELNDFASSQCAKLLARVTELERNLEYAGANQMLQAHIIEGKHNPLDTDKIIKLILEKTELQAQLTASQQETKAAVEDIALAAKETQDGIGVCVVCKHYPEDMGHGMPEICSECAGSDQCRFEWRGPQEAGEGERDVGKT